MYMIYDQLTGETRAYYAHKRDADRYTEDKPHLSMIYVPSSEV